MNRRLFSFAFVTVQGLIVGCSTAEEPENPAPTEAIVFDASEETKAELGIVRWGVDPDPFQELTTYRGYGAKNEVLAVVVQKAEDTADRHVSTLTMTGPTASASQRIEYYIDKPGTPEAVLMMDVAENSFAGGGVPLRVVERFGNDSENAPAKAAKGATTALLQAANLVQSGDDLLVSRKQLLKYCPNEAAFGTAMTQCSIEASQLISAGNAESGACNLTKRVKNPLVGCGAGLLGGFLGGPKVAIAGCILGGGTVSAQAEEECRDARADNIKKRERFDSCFRVFCPPTMRGR